MFEILFANTKASLYDEPNECPLCRQRIAPQRLNWFTPVKALDEIEYVFQCPSRECERLFIGRYKRRINDARYIYDQVEFVPSSVLPTGLSRVVNDISPDFAEIYNQAVEAEERGLRLVCGPGYRKALEFLIKDYLRVLYPDDAETIKKLLLAKCISEYVKDAQVHEVAKRAVWLGNDETHYVRKWEDKDLAALKSLIELSVHWIRMDVLTHSLLADMPEPLR